MSTAAQGMLNGVVLISSTSGALLFSKKYQPNYGLPQDDENGADGMDSMALGAMLHAFQLNASGVLNDNNSHNGDQGLTKLQVGEVNLYFHQLSDFRLLATVFASRALDSQTAHSLCSCIGQRFSTGFGHLLASGLPVPAKKFRKFGATLAEIVAGMPRTMMEGAMSCYTGKALLSALYCVYSPEFSDAMLPAAQDAQGAESNLISSLNAVQPKGSAPPSRAELSAEQVTELQGRYQLLVEIEQQEQPPTMNITSMWPAVSQLVYQSNQLLGSIQHMGDMMQSVELAVGDSEAFDRGSCMRLVVLKNAGLLVAVVVPEGQVAEISGFLRQHVMEQLETAFDFIHANKLDPSKSPVKDGRVRK